MLLAGDIGGTKTDLAIYTPEAGARAPLVQQRFPSAGYNSLEDMVREFLAQVNYPVTRACFDVAGPVVGGRAKLTNLPWVLDETELKTALKLDSVHLFNDLEAIAYAIPHLGPSDLATLNPGIAVPNGNLAVIAPGTGLGEAFLTWDGFRYRAYASEGGHCSFAPSNPHQIELLKYLWQKFDNVSFERVCSGIGIPNIYDFLKDSGYAPEVPEVAEPLARAQDRTRFIIETALDPDNPCKLCSATLAIFIEILAAEASNLALKVMATGGVYMAGGIPVSILSVLEQSNIMEAFARKGRFSELLSKVPVHVIVTSAAMIGIANYGLEMAH